MTGMKSIVVVGASLAGLNAVRALRENGFAGRIVVIGEEDARPYDRPPLSKQFLAGQMALADIALERPNDHDLDAVWRLGVRAAGLDLTDRRVLIEGGSGESFDGLVIATGCRVRRLPLCDVPGVHVMRTADDSTRLRQAMQSGPRHVVIVGGGFIGAEVAATAVSAGHEVTIVEALDQPLGRVLGAEIGAAVADLHRRHGVTVLTGVSVSDFKPDADGNVTSLKLSDGSVIAADICVVSVGVMPNVEWLEGSGIDISDGVLCDETCLVAPGIVAAGDVARWRNPLTGELRRIEHWDNAIRQARHAAQRLLGGTAEPYRLLPWVWSDQYDRKLQIYGSLTGSDEMKIVEGDLESFRFVALFRRGDRLAGVVAANLAKPLLRYRKLLADGMSWEIALAADRG